MGAGTDARRLPADRGRQRLDRRFRASSPGRSARRSCAEPRRGFGAAAHAGLLAATADLVCFCDCDGSLDPRQLPRLAAPLLAGEADLVLGRRAHRPAGRLAAARAAGQPRAGPPGPPPHRAAACATWARCARRGREALLGLNLADRRFGYPLEMVLSAAAAGWRVAEVEVAYLPRIGKSKVTGTVRGSRAHRAGHEPGAGPVTAPRSGRPAPPCSSSPSSRCPDGSRPASCRRARHEQAAALAEAALADTLHAVLAAPARAPGAGPRRRAGTVAAARVRRRAAVRRRPRRAPGRRLRRGTPAPRC